MSNALLQLKDVIDTVLIKDMNYLFQYTRVIDPGTVPSKYFNLFYKENNAPVWHVCPTGLLSEDFTIVKTEDAIEEIRSTLKAEILKQRNFRYYTTVKSNFVLAGYDLNLPKESKADEIIFKLLCGLDMQQIDSNSVLAFSIINGFSGNLSLTLNYGFMTTFSANSKTTGDVYNPYILDEFSTTLIHDGKLKIQYSDVEDIRGQCAQRVTEFKNITPGKSLFDDLEKLVNKKSFAKFMSVYNVMPKEYQNLYYLTYLISIMIDDSKKVSAELNLRHAVTAYYKEKMGKK